MEADKFNQPLNHWDVSNVTNMNMMFKDATSFNQSLDNWDVLNVNDMREMFYGASQFRYYPSNWVVSKGRDGDMFKKSGVAAIAKKNPLIKEKGRNNR
jgi:surface protein